MRQKMEMFKKALFDQVDISWLVFLRIAFGSIIFVEMWLYAKHYWIEQMLVLNPVHFKYLGFSWVQSPSILGLYLLFFAMAVLAIFVILGFRYRITMPLLAICFAYFFLLDQSRYLNHFYLFALIGFILAVLPAHKSFSLDAYFHPEIKSLTTPRWTLWLVRFQIAIPYVYGGIAKLTPDWLRGEPMRYWLHSRTDFPVIGQFFREEWMIYLMSYSGIVLDLAAVPLLLYKRTRIYAFIALLAFHGMNVYLWTIGLFPFMMVFATLVFFDPDWPRQIVNRIRSKKTKPVEVHTFKTKLSVKQKCILGGLAVFVSFQVLFPFRHLIYPGNVHWTYEGNQFSWFMLLNERRSFVLFRVIDPATGEQANVDITELLVPYQVQRVATRPDMLLQTAHLIRDSFANDGKDVEVYALVSVSLNGRDPQLLVDPYVDLAKEKRSIFHKEWILTLEEPFKKSTDGYLNDQSEYQYEWNP